MRHFIVLLIVLLTGCASTQNVPPTGTDFVLDECPPFWNCVSTSSTTNYHGIEPIQLTEPLSESAWAAIKAETLELPGASLNEARYGYVNITCYSDGLGFPDYLEVLIDAGKQQLNVRSQSRLGFYDMGVNRLRVERLRSQLVERGIAVD
ncbi:DUF1499 domain-containing protein [Marinobacter sp.]|uniref:DUF1499 domain-containing protein n=1 Tax=Marinobacter sp. TaxID=50741 RepID=UPI002B26CFB7|nr:DUF1499 domain-containing protein [Marinobacter sp.]